MAEKLSAFIREEEALTVVEYAIAAGLITAGLTAALLSLGISISTIITTISTFLTP